MIHPNFAILIGLLSCSSVAAEVRNEFSPQSIYGFNGLNGWNDLNHLTDP
jgi:hypothetical protein